MGLTALFLSRRSSLRRLGGCLLLVVLLAWGMDPWGGWAQGSERPNIVYIMADDMGFSDVGAYGATRIQTPHLDRLAREGLRFTQFRNNGKCSPTRASLLSGLYWQQTYGRDESGDISFAMEGRMARDNHVSIAEVLGEAGYHTMWIGKWHLGGVPSERGFDRTFGFLNGAINYFTGVGTGGQTDNWRLDGEVWEVPESGFYATDAFNDRAVEFVNDAGRRNKPFFLYLAYNAPHYPLQAPESLVDQYRQTFTVGWDSLRRERLAKAKRMGIIAPDVQLSPRNATAAPEYPRFEAWSKLSKEERWSEQLKMAVYAAMIDRMDQGIGRLIDQLEAQGELANTLLVFLSDNGACPFDKTNTPKIPPGPAHSFHNYDTGWANASNTPLRGYKRQSFEGGTASPFIVRWPAAIAPERTGSVTHQPAHLVDLMPTALDAAGVSYPDRFDGRDVLPTEGSSLVPIFEGRQRERRARTFWEYNRHAAVIEGNWKLVARRGQPWGLYNLENDRTEMNDLSNERPDLKARLLETYAHWAERVGARYPHSPPTAPTSSTH